MSGSREPGDQPAKGSTLDSADVLELLGAQADGLHCELRSMAEEIESGEELTADRVNAIRTEVVELQAAVEDLLADQCDATEPWEYAGEYIPPKRIGELLDGS